METAVPLQMDQNNPTKIYIKCFIDIYFCQNKNFKGEITKLCSSVGVKTF